MATLYLNICSRLILFHTTCSPSSRLSASSRNSFGVVYHRYLSTDLPSTYLPTYIDRYRPIYDIPTYWPTNRPAYRPTYRHTDLPTDLPIYLLTDLPIYGPTTYLLTYQYTYLRTYYLSIVSLHATFRLVFASFCSWFISIWNVIDVILSRARTTKKVQNDVDVQKRRP